MVWYMLVASTMWMCKVVWCLFAVVGTSLCDDKECLTVRIDSGPVRGYKDPNEDIFVFYGIPYATAPTGSKRFTAPLPSPTWSEPLEAIDDSVICPQPYPPNIQIDKVMQENCLTATVYVPNTHETNLPVVVYIHGGGFIIGYGNLLTPKKMVSSKRMIAVTFNYRLAAHGFLCLGTEDVPGNAGMKDQVALLHWVKRNIANFGGNPNDVTITGWSAGSSSVDLMLLSKMTRGLFNKVIPESGASFSPFSVQVDPIENAKELAALLKYNGTDDIYELQNFLTNTTYEVLQSANIGNRVDFTFLMGPCVERDLGKERFLEDSPLQILKSGDFDKLPMLYGFAHMEGLMRIDSFDMWKDRMNEKFSDFLPADLQFKNEKEKSAVAAKIRRFYFGDKEVGDETVLEFVDFFTDVLFACPTLRSIKYQLKANNSQIYLYEYTYVDDDTPFVPYTNVRGAGHCAQTVAVLDGTGFMNPFEDKISNDLENMKRIMRELWQNFILSGKPESSDVPAWPPVCLDWSPHMELKAKPELKGSLLEERCRFWEEIHDKYYRQPEPPSTCSAQTK